MSWHCMFCGKSDRNDWCKIMVAPLHGIAQTFVCHISCLKKKTHKEADNIKDSLNIMIEDSKECLNNEKIAEQYARRTDGEL